MEEDLRSSGEGLRGFKSHPSHHNGLHKKIRFVFDSMKVPYLFTYPFSAKSRFDLPLQVSPEFAVKIQIGLVFIRAGAF
jgi:hypothetical protein